MQLQTTRVQNHYKMTPNSLQKSQKTNREQSTICIYELCVPITKKKWGNKKGNCKKKKWEKEEKNKMGKKGGWRGEDDGSGGAACGSRWRG